MSNYRAPEFIELIERFVNGEIPVQTFESAYLQLFARSSYYPEPIQGVLEELFFDVDAFCEEEAHREPGDLSESELKQKAAEAVKRLRTIV